ncbi:MAG TPA: hypothetical protein VF532_06175 [Candidatus Angelobacter sp.]
MIRRLSLLLIFLLAVAGILGGRSKATPLPPQGIVPDEETAVNIAKTVFARIFTSEEIAKYNPYHVQFKDGVWTVYGYAQARFAWRDPTTKNSKERWTRT